MINRLIEYLKNSKRELKKVSWPTKDEVYRHTALVIAIIIAMGIFLGLVDFGLSRLLGLLIK